LSAPPLGEFDLIKRFFVRAPTAARESGGVAVGIGDDAALIEVPPGEQLVAAVDTILEGRHFYPGTDARSVGHRALAVNLSDMAAMGATPAWATLALSIPSADPAWLGAFAAGLLDLADAHGVSLVGGDTTRGPLTISVQILGHLPRGTALLRGGAQPGDLLVVTGTLGDAGAGLNYVKTPPVGVADAADVRSLVARFEYPTPRVAMGIAARGIASAAMDISDGLVGDLPKLAQASGLGANVVVQNVPLSKALRAVATPAQAREWALSAGDDYELLLTVAPPRYVALQAEAQRLNLTLSIIGEMRSAAGITWSLDGAPFVPRSSGFDHFG
jgi:thiamine-monophosphate kinase